MLDTCDGPAFVEDIKAKLDGSLNYIKSINLTYESSKQKH